MRRRGLLAVFMSALCIAAAIPSASVLADGQKVVTLGADLSEDQKQAILRYFGVAGQNLLTLTITNQDERNHLGSYVPLEQIGSRTYSCALVNPTNAGGIQVKTANLTWVTSNMIATTLSTSGVVNCEVLAASPFEVSGTGALTGILMAYESAVGTPLDEQKKEVATQELITTTTIANNIGQVQATDIVNESKMEVIQQSQQNNIVNATDIDVIVNEVAEEENIDLSEEDRQLLVDLMEQIVEQNYEYEDMRTTLERVEQNMDQIMEQQNNPQAAQTEDTAMTEQVPAAEIPAAEIPVAGGESTEPTEIPSSDSGAAEQSESIPENAEQTETPETLPPDSILNNTDDSALGESTVFDATDESVLTQTEAQPLSETEPTGDIEIFNTDEYTSDPSTVPTEQTPDIYIQSESTEIPEMQVPEQDVPQQTEVPVVQPETLPEENMQDEYGIDTMMPELEDPLFEVPETVTEAPEVFTEAPEIFTEAPEVLTELPEAVTDVPAAPILTAITAEEMEFAPHSEMGEMLPAGINELTISFQRSDMIAGTGSISLVNAFDDSVIETIPAADSSKVVIEPLDDEELGSLGWSEGCKATVRLNSPMAQLSYYYVTMTENAFSSADGTAMSAALEDPQTWAVQTSEYGFSIDRSNLTAGSTVSGQIMMDGTSAVVAYIENADPSMIGFDQGEFSASGSFTATLNMAGTTSFQVSFYDEAGTLLNTIDYTLEIK